MSDFTAPKALHIPDETGRIQSFGPGSNLPDWANRLPQN